MQLLLELRSLPLYLQVAAVLSADTQGTDFEPAAADHLTLLLLLSQWPDSLSDCQVRPPSWLL